MVIVEMLQNRASLDQCHITIKIGDLKAIWIVMFQVEFHNSMLHITNRCGTVVTDFDWEAKTR